MKRLNFFTLGHTNKYKDAVSNIHVMAALAPPPNTMGINLLPVPQNPPVLTDITNAKEYMERLSHIKCDLCYKYPLPTT